MISLFSFLTCIFLHFFSIVFIHLMVLQYFFLLYIWPDALSFVVMLLGSADPRSPLLLNVYLFVSLRFSTWENGKCGKVKFPLIKCLIAIRIFQSNLLQLLKINISPLCCETTCKNGIKKKSESSHNSSRIWLIFILLTVKKSFVLSQN